MGVTQLWTRFLDAVEQVEAEADAARAERGPRRLDWHVFAVIILVCVSLSIQEYYGSSSHYRVFEPLLKLFMEDAPRWLDDTFIRGDYGRLHRLFYWVSGTFFCYVALPILYIKAVRRDRVRDYGLSVQGILSHSWIYIGMYLLVLPALFVVGLTPSFQHTYPFYKQAHRSAYDFFAWELAYAVQFMSLEFFFRGFLIHALKRRFGFYCIVISTIPYCMIHFGKPMPETLGAIFAGLALGTLSLFTRSIWLGVAIHVSVAVSMDVISLWYQGKLF